MNIRPVLFTISSRYLNKYLVKRRAEESGHHHHLVCQSCGTVTDIDESTLSSLRDILMRDYKFQAELRHVGVFGICENCRKKKSKGGGKP